MSETQTSHAPLASEEARIGLQVIADYFQWLASLPDTHRVYRGHAKTEWDLIPSAGRPGRSGIDTQQLLNRWKRRVGPVVDRAPISDLEWLVLAQHYQVATPLLDWTTSPLAALYFATAEFDLDWAYVYAMPIVMFAEYDSHLSIDAFATTERELILLPTDSMNVRARAQRSWMTLHRPATTNAWTYAPDETAGHLGLKISSHPIDADHKRAVRAALAALGFDSVSMMSDVQSAANNFSAELGDIP